MASSEIEAPTIKVFISHSSRDVALAKPVIDLLRLALNLSAEEIRCTSVPGHKLPGGAQAEQQIRQELLEAPVFIGLVTEAGISSIYVLFELGARWGSGNENRVLSYAAGLKSWVEKPRYCLNYLDSDLNHQENQAQGE